MIVIDHVLNRLHGAGMLCTVQKPISHGIQLRLSNGGVVNIYTNGKIFVQGTQIEDVRRVLGLDTLPE